MVSCSNLGKKGILNCTCPIRLTAGTVHSLIQQLITIFEGNKRGRTWDFVLKFCNPAASREVQLYLKAVQEEQLGHMLSQNKQSQSFSFKLLKIASYILRQCVGLIFLCVSAMYSYGIKLYLKYRFCR